MFYIFFAYIKISKDSSAKYNQNNLRRLLKKLVKDIKVFLKTKKKKSKNMITKIKIYEKIKNSCFLSIVKGIKWPKTPCYNCKKLLFCNGLESSDLESSVFEAVLNL